jgi:hypothetical protein
VLVGNLNIDVFQMDRIAEVLGGTIEMFLHGGRP